jgi:hypothetical protein
MSLPINQNLETIINCFDPNSKLENAVYYCCGWLLTCGNFLTEFKFINDKIIGFEDVNSGKQFQISYKWNSEKWKWEFSSI